MYRVRVRILKRIFSAAVGVCTIVLLVRTISNCHNYVPVKLTEGDVTYRNLEKLSDECVRYHRLFNVWPTTLAALQSAIKLQDTNCLKDGWGREFILLTHTNAPGPIWLISHGADGLQGGNGSNADFVMQLP